MLRKTVKGLIIFSLVCVCWTKFAPDTAPKIEKEDTKMIKKKINEKLNEKKWYQLYLHEEGAWITTLRIPTFDRLTSENKKHLGVEKYGDGTYVVYQLCLDKEELLVFKTVYKNYIKLFMSLEENSELRSVVFKQATFFF